MLGRLAELVAEAAEQRALMDSLQVEYSRSVQEREAQLREDFESRLEALRADHARFREDTEQVLFDSPWEREGKVVVVVVVVVIGMVMGS